MNIVKMRQLQVQLVLLVMYMTFAINSTESRQCQLIKPDAVNSHMEPEQVPLLIYITMDRLRIRDVPVSGGSFGIEFS